MSKIASKISVPIILVGLFAIAVFIAMDYEQLIGDFILFFVFLCLCFFLRACDCQSLASHKRNIRRAEN